MEEYRRTFEALAAPLVDLPEEVLVSIFINELKPTIKAEVRLHRPIGLTLTRSLQEPILEPIAPQVRIIPLDQMPNYI